MFWILEGMLGTRGMLGGYQIVGVGAVLMGLTEGVAVPGPPCGARLHRDEGGDGVRER